MKDRRQARTVRPVGARELAAVDLRRQRLITDEKTVALVNMESTFADLRSKYDTPRPSTSNVKMARPQSQPHDIDMSTFNGVGIENEVDVDWDCAEWSRKNF